MHLIFRRHPWPYASAFSLIGCYARINVLNRKELLTQWLTPKRLVQLNLRLPEDLSISIGIDGLRRTFDLGTEAASMAFDRCAWWPANLRKVAERTVSGLRFCPICLRQGYHSEMFQLPWWQRCALHDERIAESCPKCGSHIHRSWGLSRNEDPGRLFHCTSCGFDLANSAAIIGACRQGVPEVLHQLVGSHRRWMREIDAQYVVPPVFGREPVLLKPTYSLAFLSISRIPPPSDLSSFVEIPSEAPPFPLQIEVKRGARHGGEDIRLAQCLKTSFKSTVHGEQRCDPLNFDQAKLLLGVERRLQRSFSRVMSRSHWDSLNKPQGGRKAHNKFSEHFPIRNAAKWEDGFLERGYRRRFADMRVSTSLGGNSFFNIRESELQGLTACRFLIGLTVFLDDVESTAPEHSALRQIAEWWRNHFLVSTLIDATIYATHVNSYIDKTASDPLLNGCWPPIQLDRAPPGHEWGIAATTHMIGKYEFVTAYIACWPHNALVSPERWRGKETFEEHEQFAREMANTITLLRAINSA